MKTSMRMLLSFGVVDRFGDCAGATLIKIALIEPPQDFAAIGVEKLLQLAMSHTIDRL
jgi:hypothetical protein